MPNTNDRDNTTTMDIRISELQRMIILEALSEYIIAHKNEPDNRCIRHEAMLLECFFSEAEIVFETEGINDISPL